jgi:transposase
VFHSEGFKARMVARMAGPESISACALAREVGVSQASLSRWLLKARSLRGMSQHEESSKSPRSWTPQEKFRVVVEASRLKPDELGAFLRREGLHEAQLREWMQAAVEGLGASSAPGSQRVKNEDKRRIRELERELRRKDSALAEVTAILALQKKLRALWGDADDGTDTRSGT